MKNYIVIIGDLEASKELGREERQAAQSSLETLFSHHRFSSQGIISPYTLTLGDEFQAVYNHADNLFLHIWSISAAIYPVMIRWAISTGEINTPINKKQALGMDGPAFHRSRNGIELLKEEKELFRIETGHQLFDRLSNSSLQLLTAGLRTWNKNRFLILDKLSCGSEVKQIAADLGISDVAVYKNIHAGKLEAVIEYAASLSQFLNQQTG